MQQTNYGTEAQEARAQQDLMHALESQLEQVKDRPEVSAYYLSIVRVNLQQQMGMTLRAQTRAGQVSMDQYQIASTLIKDGWDGSYDDLITTARALE